MDWFFLRYVGLAVASALIAMVVGKSPQPIVSRESMTACAVVFLVFGFMQYRKDNRQP